jgi:L-amino acid N-acyltransferase YncA
MAGGSLVRPASARGRACLHCDLPPIPYVEDTAITFETEVPDKHEMAARIAAARETHEWLILEQDDELIGYAYAHAFNSRAAYQWSAETSIYIAYARHGAGNGRRLYGQLRHRLSERGYRRAFAGITQPNDASNGFHRSFGFQQAGLYRRVGWKNGRLARRCMDAIGSARRRQTRRAANGYQLTACACKAQFFRPADLGLLTPRG